MSKSIDLYLHYASPPCRAVLMLGKALNITFQLKEVDLLGGETRTEEYKKLNPQGVVPFIVDGGFALSESRAIMEYLVNTYAKDAKSEAMFPKAAQAQAVVSSRLYYDAASLLPAFANAYVIPLRTGSEVQPALVEKLNESLNVLNMFLEGQQWVAGKDLTIADISLVSTVSSIEAMKHNLSAFKNVVRWLNESKKTIPGYDLNQKGVDIIIGMAKARQSKQ